ncbi:branched-chain amino acid ABC transporter permease [Haloferax sulfurifontis]|uniref:Branched-chain amino acid ABC transporter permease n=1 Tax=Haloferax sulfurifontis TaxID=255616 RepID=A0A830E0U5_9EURY|nr:branched-chain amino acid ABC transporter permease [Haloferax sulfurifontis]GGC66594.1 branched-chain amino acid ABC transporter permease [Haloferax sulfurifontis]
MATSTLRRLGAGSRSTPAVGVVIASALLFLLTFAVFPDLFVQNLIGGVAYGMVLAIIALGLALILGLLGVVNFAHGGLFMLGAYGAYEIVVTQGLSFWAALVVVPIAVGVLGVAMEVSVLRRLYGKNPVIGLLATFGVFLMIEEATRARWGGTPLTFEIPPALQGAIPLGVGQIATIRLLTVVVAAFIIVGIYSLMYRTDFGLTIRAGLQDREMAEFIGINIPMRFTIVFFLGSAIAGLAGVLRGAETGMDLSLGFEFVLLAFVIVIIGGVGSIFGSVVSGLLVGVSVFILPVTARALASVTGVDALNVAGIGGVVPYIVMLVVLLVRPRGLFGEEGLLE